MKYTVSHSLTQSFVHRTCKEIKDMPLTVEQVEQIHKAVEKKLFQLTMEK